MVDSTFMNDVFNPILGAFSAGIVGVITATVQGCLRTRSDKKKQSQYLKLELERIKKHFESLYKILKNPIPDSPPTHTMEIENDFGVDIIKTARPYVEYLSQKALDELDKLIYDLSLLNSLMERARRAAIQNNDEYRNVKLVTWWNTFEEKAADHITGIGLIIKELKS